MKVRIEIDLTRIWIDLVDLAGRFRISHFLLLYFAIHMLQIAFPSDGSMVFDEAHYVPASLKTLEGIAANAEHPPLPKIIGAIGIALFGNNWFGWRFPQVVMQVAALYLFYLIAKRLLGDPWALGGTMLLGLDTVFFIHGGTLLIDMPSFLFGFLAIELYFRKRYRTSALSMGLALLAREMSVFTLATLGIYHLVTNRRSLRPALKIGLKYALIALIVFGGLLWAYDWTYRPASATSITNIVTADVVLGPNGSAVTTVLLTSQSTSRELIWNPVQHVLFIEHYHGPAGIVINETYAPYQYAWNWVLPNDPFNSPTYFRVDVSIGAGTLQHYIPIWYVSQANLPLWYGFWPAIVGLAFAFWRRRDWETAMFIASGIALNFTPWIILSLTVRRIGFNYYFIYTLPYVALGLVFALKLLPRRFGIPLLIIELVASAAFFMWFFPVHPTP